MESNQRFYLRRASEERTAALRSITAQAREWHSRLAADFAARAMAASPSMPMPFSSQTALSA